MDNHTVTVKKIKSDNAVLRDNLYSTVEKNLSEKSILNKLDLAISKYMDRNVEQLWDTGLTKKIFFLETDKEAIYDACGLDKNKIKQTIKLSPYIKSSWKILNEPLNTAAILALRYFAKKGDKKHLELFLIYYSSYFYATIHYKYFRFEANKNIMDYTINNLTKKFKIKQYGSVYETIKNTALTSHETYLDELLRGEDGDFAKYVSALKTRLNDVVKNVKNEYEKNREAEKFMNYDEDDYSEDNYHIANNTSYIVRNVTQAAVIKLNTYGADMRLASLAAQLSQVSKNEIRNVITHLSDNDTKEITRLCEIIIQLFLEDGTNSSEDIRSKKFLAKCLEIYKKSNTNDKIILEMKNILDKWLQKNSAKYRQINRPATLSNFRKAIFIYFVLHIQISSR